MDQQRQGREKGENINVRRPLPFQTGCLIYGIVLDSVFVLYGKGQLNEDAARLQSSNVLLPYFDD